MDIWTYEDEDNKLGKLLKNDKTCHEYAKGNSIAYMLKNVKDYNTLHKAIESINNSEFELCFKNNYQIPVSQSCIIYCYKETVEFLIPCSSKVSRMKYENIHKHTFLRQSTVNDYIYIEDCTNE